MPSSAPKYVSLISNCSHRSILSAMGPSPKGTDWYSASFLVVSKICFITLGFHAFSNEAVRTPVLQRDVCLIPIDQFPVVSLTSFLASFVRLTLNKVHSLICRKKTMSANLAFCLCFLSIEWLSKRIILTTSIKLRMASHPRISIRN